MTTRSKIILLCAFGAPLWAEDVPPVPVQDSAKADQYTLDLGVSTIVAEGTPKTVEENTRSVSVLDAEALKEKHPLSLSDALRNQPGIELVGQGPNISKPSIRGMTNQRVVLVRDGIRHEAQQWSNHHTPEVDISDAEQIEVLRGPGSLLYGSGALGGVVLVRSPAVETLRDGADTLGGLAEYLFFTNSAQHMGHVALHGATDSWMWRTDLSGRYSPYYAVPGDHHFLAKVPASAVTDTAKIEYAAFKNYNLRLLGGWKGDGSELSLSGTQYWEEQQLIGEGHWHNSGGPNGGPWYHVGEPIRSPTLHQKVQLHGEQDLEGQDLSYDVAFQHDHRKGITGSAGVQVNLENFVASGNLRWNFVKREAVTRSLGLSFSQKWDRTHGVEVLIPDCNTT
ncbi:MAG TPA: TonB-dependent receptor plug domain-containing protein, partial [Fibrobacteraceae bacterium]|nr:TonB-dependent receptor plug domain-containing protein [Fibrobacteraceae bacterium]